MSDRRTPPVFGDLAVSYLVREGNPGTSRLVVKLLIRYPRGPVGWLMRAVLPAGDLVMMRRQLLNFRDLAQAITAP